MFVYFNFVAKRPLRNFFTTENIPIYGKPHFLMPGRIYYGGNRHILDAHMSVLHEITFEINLYIHLTTNIYFNHVHKYNDNICDLICRNPT